MFRVKRGPEQENRLAQFQNAAEQELSGVNADFQFFGDARLMTAIVMPKITPNNLSLAEENAAAIQAALDSAAPWTTIQLINDKFYCNQINITPEHSTLCIQGGPNTLIINRVFVFPQNRMVFTGLSERVGYITRMGGYVPGTAGVDTFEVYDQSGGDPNEFEVNDMMYVCLPYFQQTASNSRLCQMVEVIDVAYPSGRIVVTVNKALSTTMGATDYGLSP